jgi:hypothetical protein
MALSRPVTLAAPSAMQGPTSGQARVPNDQCAPPSEVSSTCGAVSPPAGPEQGLDLPQRTVPKTAEVHRGRARGRGTNVQARSQDKIEQEGADPRQQDG